MFKKLIDHATTVQIDIKKKNRIYNEILFVFSNKYFNYENKFDVKNNDIKKVIRKIDNLKKYIDKNVKPETIEINKECILNFSTLSVDIDNSIDMTAELEIHFWGEDNVETSERDIL